MRRMPAATARRVALAAQGFCDPPPRGRVDARLLRRAIGRMKLLQLDAVNVVVRSHYLPVFSRLGPYERALLDDLAWNRGEMFEYWAHEASLLPVGLHPLFRWRMEANWGHWGERMSAKSRAFVEEVYAQVQERGPLVVGDLDEPGERRGPWWGWREGKSALEFLFRTGRVTTAGRRNFERQYDLPERVLPGPVLEASTPAPAEAMRALLLHAAEALGVGTEGDIVDYFRLHGPTCRPMVRELAATGELVPVEVEGWKDVGYLHPEARVPRRVDAAALLSPFDPVVWCRPRTERLFGFHYRIEIYTPAPKRRFGYYVLPFLLGDELVGRVDVKADRQAGVLRVPAAYVEGGHDPAAVAGPLHEQLAELARWLGLAPPGPVALLPAAREVG